MFFDRTNQPPQPTPTCDTKRQLEELRAIVVRMETRLCVLMRHMGAETKIESRNKK